MMWHDITWIGLGYWWWILFFAILGLVAFILMYQKIKIISKLINFHLQITLIKINGFKRICKWICYLMGLICLYAALLRPTWDKKEQIVQQEGRDVLVLLDISRSMLAADIKPNRLIRAKEKIKTLLARLSCDRVGLIVFSGSAVVQCPLTTDYQTFLLFLDQLDTETISSGTTALDEALKKAIGVFRAMPEKKNKLVFLLTDGEDFSSNLHAIKQDARDMHMHILAMGVGTSEGAPVPIYDNRGFMVGHERDAKGAVVMSRLNEGILQSLVHDAGGNYVRITQNDEDICYIFNQIEQFERENFEDKKIEIFQEKYYYFVGAAFLFFLMEWLL